MARRILIVDDHDDTREALAELLADEGFEVIEAGDGRQAYERLTSATPPDAVLLDLTMPNMDGWELHAEMLKNDTLSRVPVIVMTAAHEKLRNSIAVDEVVKKPFVIEALLAALERQIRAEDLLGE